MAKRRLYNGKVLKVTILDEYHDFEICYIGKDKICLLCKEPLLNDVDYNTAAEAEWDVELIYDGNVYTGKCKIPTAEELQEYCSNIKRDFKYWTSTKWFSCSAYFVSDNGQMYHHIFAYRAAALPFITLEV